MTEAIARASGRVIAIDPLGRILLIAGRHEGRRIWITPGGGCWPGEDLVATACREFEEETGLRLAPESVGGVVAFNAGLWTALDGTHYDSADSYFAVHVEAFEPSAERQEELERVWIEEFRWWPLDEIDASQETVWPLGLSALVRRILADDWPSEPVKLAWHHDL